MATQSRDPDYYAEKETHMEEIIVLLIRIFRRKVLYNRWTSVAYRSSEYTFLICIYRYLFICLLHFITYILLVLLLLFSQSFGLE